jgi:hypothetical protein
MVGRFGRVRGWVGAASVAILVASGGVARAQPGEAKQLDRGDRVGTLMQVAPGRIQVRLKNSGETWVVVAAPDATVEVNGTASREMLQPKQFVQVSVELDGSGKVLQPVEKVTFPGAGTPGVVAGGLGLSDPKAKRAPGKRPAGTYLVSGPIKSVEGDEITIQIGRDRFQIPVATEADLEVATTNIALANPGDDVELEGEYYQKGQLIASSIKVKLVNPLMPVQPKNKARRPVRAP